MSKSKQKGTAFERLIADFLNENLPGEIDRAPLYGNGDRGDISGVKSPFGKVVIECKNVTKLSLSQWVEQADVERGNADAHVGVVVHKRRGKGEAKHQYVTMTLENFTKLLGG